MFWGIGVQIEIMIGNNNVLVLRGKAGVTFIIISKSKEKLVWC